MTNLIQSLLPYAVLASHVLLVVLVLALISHKTWGKDISRFLGKNAIAIGVLITLAAVLGSLFYSEVVGFEPCKLCWWQRLFIFPQAVLFLTALKFKDRGVFRYAWRLSALAGAVGVYQQYVYLGGKSILPCTALGGACSKVYVMALGYITIPMMSITIALYVITLAWANRLYENRNA